MYLKGEEIALGIGFLLASVFLFLAVWIGSGSFSIAITVFFSVLAFFTLILSLVVAN